MAVIESVVTDRTNGALIDKAAKLWIQPTDYVVDATYGRGKWWSDYHHPGPFVGHDLNTLDGVDFRELPEPDGSVDVVMFDPPYIPSNRAKSTIPDFNDRYGIQDNPKTDRENRELIADGLAECYRILKPKGYLLAKSMDYINAGKYQAGHYYVLAYCVNWMHMELVDEFVHVTGAGPQPKTNLDGSPRRQLHSRRVHSFLSVFQKGK